MEWIIFIIMGHVIITFVGMILYIIIIFKDEKGRCWKVCLSNRRPHQRMGIDDGEFTGGCRPSRIIWNRITIVTGIGQDHILILFHHIYIRFTTVRSFLFPTPSDCGWWWW